MTKCKNLGVKTLEIKEIFRETKSKNKNKGFKMLIKRLRNKRKRR